MLCYVKCGIYSQSQKMVWLYKKLKNMKRIFAYSVAMLITLLLGSAALAQEKSTETTQPEKPAVKEGQKGPKGPMMHQGEFRGWGQQREFRGPPQGGPRGPMFRGGPLGPQGPRFAQGPRGPKGEGKCQCQCHEKRGKGKGQGKQFRGGERADRGPQHGNK